MTTTFEDRLAAELTAIVAASPAPVTTLQRTRTRRRRGLVLGGAGAAAAAAAIVLLQSGASPAYAVEKSADGTVTVTIDRAEDAAGLEQALRDQGVNAYVDYLPDGQACAPGRFTPLGAMERSTMDTRVTGSSEITFSITSNQLKPGVALVIEDGMGGDLSAMSMAFAQGEVKPCTPVDASTVPGPAGPDGGLSQSGGSADSGPGFSTHRDVLPSPPA